MQLIRKAAGFFAKLADRYRKTMSVRQLEEEILLLKAGKKNAVSEYYSKKRIRMLLAVLLLLPLCMAVVLFTGEDVRPVPDEGIPRDGYTGQERSEELLVEAEGESEEQVLTIPVQKRRFTASEATRQLNLAKEELEEGFLGSNASADAVRDPLWFPTALADGSVSVSWLTIPYGLIAEDGSIASEPEEGGTLVEVRAELTCQTRTLQYERTVRVLPPVLSKQEQFWKRVRTQAGKADEEQAEEPSLQLPGEVDGRRLVWKYPDTRPGPGIFLLIPLVLLLIFTGMDQRVHEQAKNRSAQLLLDYQDLLWKLSTLLGAGITIRSAFIRIGDHYRREHTGAPRYVYEEVLYTCHEMKMGVPEGKAYEAFGRRCGLPCYIKLGSVLASNLQKGSKGLPQALAAEASSSMEDLRREARKLGEQAGTRMLFPMILMLGVVLVILMAPAFMSL